MFFFPLVSYFCWLLYWSMVYSDSSNFILWDRFNLKHPIHIVLKHHTFVWSTHIKTSIIIASTFQHIAKIPLEWILQRAISLYPSVPCFISIFPTSRYEKDEICNIRFTIVHECLYLITWPALKIQLVQFQPRKTPLKARTQILQSPSINLLAHKERIPAQ